MMKSKQLITYLALAVVLAVSVSCSSSDQGAINQAVSATLAAAQPATATSTPVSATLEAGQPATATSTPVSATLEAGQPATATSTPVKAIKTDMWELGFASQSRAEAAWWKDKLVTLTGVVVNVDKNVIAVADPFSFVDTATVSSPLEIICIYENSFQAVANSLETGDVITITGVMPDAMTAEPELGNCEFTRFLDEKSIPEEVDLDILIDRSITSDEYSKEWEPKFIKAEAVVTKPIKDGDNVISATGERRYDQGDMWGGMSCAYSENLKPAAKQLKKGDLIQVQGIITGWGIKSTRSPFKVTLDGMWAAEINSCEFELIDDPVIPIVESVPGPEPTPVPTPTPEPTAAPIVYNYDLKFCGISQNDECAEITTAFVGDRFDHTVAEITPPVDSNNYRFEMLSASGARLKFPAEIYKPSVFKSTENFKYFGWVGTYTLILIESDGAEVPIEREVATKDLIVQAFDFDQHWTTADVLDYNDILTNPDNYITTHRISGVVNQILGYDDEYTGDDTGIKYNRYAMDLNGSWDEVMVVRMAANQFERLVEGDQVDMYSGFDFLGEVNLVDGSTMYYPYFTTVAMRSSTSTPTPTPAATPTPTPAATPTPTPAATPTPTPIAVPMKIAFDSDRDGNPQIYVMDADGSNRTRITSNYVDSQPSWSPDGSKIAFTSERERVYSGLNYEIYVMDADGSNQTRITSNYADSQPSWSPDGSKITFTSERDGNKEIYIIDADGSNQTRLTSSSKDDANPSWSPDGSKIAFTSKRHGNNEIYVMDVDGSNVKRLTGNSRSDNNPSWSPDGSKIAFMSIRDGNEEIYVMAANGSNQTSLAKGGNPSWSLDGSKIYFTSDRDENMEIYVMDADGSNQIRITNNSESENNPSWGPVS